MKEVDAQDSAIKLCKYSMYVKYSQKLVFKKVGTVV